MGRMFSVPFPNLSKDESVGDVIEYYKVYKDSIENVYLGIPSLGNNYHNPFYHLKNLDSFVKTEEEYNKECIDFLEKTIGIFKRIITLNSGFYNLSDDDLRKYVNEKIVPFADYYRIEGFICTDFNMACYLHEKRPDLELHTSCNSYIENVREMDMWHKWAGISVFNPPREFLRRPEKLKEMRATGYRLKYLVNESCLFGCPQSKNHLAAQALGNKGFCSKCHHGEISNFFRSVAVVPRWLKKLDAYVDIYKLSGRNCSFKVVKDAFEAYYYEKDDVNAVSIMFGAGVKKGLNINVKDFPDKLLWCECKNCHTCGICDNIPVDQIIYKKSDLGDEDYYRLLEVFSNLKDKNMIKNILIFDDRFEVIR